VATAHPDSPDPGPCSWSSSWLNCWPGWSSRQFVAADHDRVELLAGDCSGIPRFDHLEDVREMVRAGADDVPADRLQVHRAYRRPTAPPQSTTGQRLVSANPLISLVPEKGVEPSTFSLRMSCSTN
jgi:hypothetical protein